MTHVGLFWKAELAGDHVRPSGAPGLGFVKRTSKEGTGWELKEYSGLKPIEIPNL